VLAPVAQAQHLKTFSDLGKWVAGGGKLKLAASAEFVNSASALPSFEKAYGFKLKQDQLVVLSGGDTAATIKAAANQTDGVNAAMVYGTDGGIASSGLVVLDDDKHVQPVCADAGDSRSRAEGASANRRLSETGVRQPRPEDAAVAEREIQINGEPAAGVAKRYLKSKGFVK
jgi:osmoprotectant transport system substrate-binding protein